MNLPRGVLRHKGKTMLNFLRIVFTILSAICLALALLLGTWLGGGWAVLSLLAALAFFGLMLLCKNAIDKKEEESKPKQPTFFDPNPNGERDSTEQTQEQDKTE